MSSRCVAMRIFRRFRNGRTNARCYRVASLGRQEVRLTSADTKLDVSHSDYVVGVYTHARTRGKSKLNGLKSRAGSRQRSTST